MLLNTDSATFKFGWWSSFGEDSLQKGFPMVAVFAKLTIISYI